MDFNNLTLTDGVFVKELKNRFLCEVLINDESVECYVPSSCHLSNFIDMSNCKVLLKKNPENARTKYSLFAFEYKQKFILLNTSIANTFIYEQISSRKFNFLGPRKKIHKEFKFENYKSDLFIEDTKSFIEIKSLISLDETGLFPTVYSERTLQQLIYFLDYLKRGYKIYFFIISLNPFVNRIKINKNTSFYALLEKCISLGLQLYGFKIDYTDDIKIKKIPCTI